MADWLREHGWLLARASDARPTHLLLDGGRARVPDESAGAFLNAYAIAVVQGLRPCLVELRTPVFRLFLDLDVVERADHPLDFARVMTVLQRRVGATFEEDAPRAVVCATPPAATADGGLKAGRHVVWTNVWCTAATALALRAAVVDDLQAELPDACVKPWTAVVDACVFRANGLRMPWSAKARGGAGVYVPVEAWTAGGAEAVGEVGGVSAVRRWVRELSIRAPGHAETPVREGAEVVVDEEQAAEGVALRGTTTSLAAYEAVLPALLAALPAPYAGSRFIAAIRAESCFILRSSSRYCANVEREHTASNVYFVLSLKGVRQKCYCRNESIEGRRWGLCRDYGGETHPVPDEVLTAFFGAPAVEEATAAFKLPSAKSAGSMASLESLLARSRPPPPKAPRRKKAKA